MNQQAAVKKKRTNHVVLQTRTPCHKCQHGTSVAPFKIFCEAGEGMMGDMYASGMLTDGRCVMNRNRK